MKATEMDSAGCTALRLRLVLLCLFAFWAGTACTPEKSVRPGINKSFLDPDLDVNEYLQRFETEDREIFAHRDEIVKTINLKPGMTIADIGSGTGLFVVPFAKAVGQQGKVYAVDIAPGFIQHINKLVKEERLENVVPVLCKEDSVELPIESVDIAFICDTYHHFEYPNSTMASLCRALRPGGQVVVIDFHRIEGVSSDWILSHVRAGEEVFTAEIEAAGFREGQPTRQFLQQNYILRFVKIDVKE
ncbi:MAG: methyltransferase domain-containing protein [Planctomycetota bacterium]